MLELTKRLSEEEAAGIDSSEILDNLILPYELRIRGRLRATTQTRVDVGLFLDRGPVLRDGDLLLAKPERSFASARPRNRWSPPGSKTASPWRACATTWATVT